MHWWYGDGHMGWMGLWWFLGLAMIAVLVWGLLRAGQRPGGTVGPGESAQEILKRRYARGEIDRETYQRMLKDLEG